MLRLNVKSSFRLIVELKNAVQSDSCRRNLYAATTLGLDGFLLSRERVNGQFLHNVDKFREKMASFVDSKNSNMIFTEDLKNMIHLAEKNTRDIDLIVKMLLKYNTQNKELSFGNYVFGPVMLRMLYHLGDAETALKCFKDPTLEGFFDQLISHQLLLDLLYENGRYQDVLDVFEIIKSRQAPNGKYSRHVVVLTMASCYKMNTPKSFDFSVALLREIQEAGYVPMRKAATFAAALALAHNAPHVALEVLSNQKDQQYLTIRNLKAMAYAAMNRPEDALPILRSVLEVDDPGKQKRTFNREVINSVRKSIEKNERKDLEADFNRIEKFLIDQGHISEEPLSDILCSQITSTSYSTQRQDKSFLAASFSKDRNYRPKSGQRNNNFRHKQGLQDLY